MSATPDRKERKDLLEVLASRHTLPEGCDTWAIKSVRPDLTTRGGSFQWPLPGGVVEASAVVPENTSPIPRAKGDGVCAGKTWRGMATARIPAITLLLVAYSAAEHLLGADGDKVRLRCAHVVALVDGAALLVKGGAESDLSGAHLSGAHLSGAYLIGAHLDGADLRGADLRRADLRRADLSGAYLIGAHLIGAHLDGADLRGADLRRADLRRADLRRADLIGADLSGAYLDGAYLDGADLDGAYLDGAYLDRAYLNGANLSGALRRSDAPAGWTIHDEGVLVRTSNGDEWADESTIREVPE